MATNTEFIAHILELLEGHYSANARRMFGGHGIFRDGLMFGLVSNDTLFLKVDDENRDDFVQRDLEAFTYQKKVKQTSLSYYQVPEECLEGAEEMITWSDKAFAAALRADKKKKKME